MENKYFGKVACSSMILGFALITTSVAYGQQVSVNTEAEQRKEVVQELIELEPAQTNLQEMSYPYTGLDTSFKSYMDYRMITDETSEQYKYINLSGEVSLNEQGFLVTSDDYVGVALGSFFGKVGDKFNFKLDTGEVLKVVKVEQKSDAHTCSKKILAENNNAIEFVIDTHNTFFEPYLSLGSLNSVSSLTGSIVGVARVLE